MAGSSIKSDEMIVFFPGYGSRLDEKTWELHIRGWIFEWERRPGVATAFSKVLGIDRGKLSETERDFFSSRTRLFLVDAERDKKIFIHLAGRVFELGPSDVTGHFSAKIKVADSELVRVQENMISFRAMTAGSDSRMFSGTIQLIEPRGISVVSDIDDTIKVSEILDRKKLLRNTFLREFVPAPGMAELYQSWAKQPEVGFHYLSASPSQLYDPLQEFLAASQFPMGSIHLRAFDWRTEFKDHSQSKKHKPAVLESLLTQFPGRRFVLVGDSGESDPEIYADAARQFPNSVEKILIRDVNGESADSGRYRETFFGIERNVWTVFKEPSEIPSLPFQKNGSATKAGK